MFVLMAVFLTCLVETEMFLLMTLTIESYGGSPVLTHCSSLTVGMCWSQTTSVCFVQIVHPETCPCAYFLL